MAHWPAEVRRLCATQHVVLAEEDLLRSEAKSHAATVPDAAQVLNALLDTGPQCHPDPEGAEPSWVPTHGDAADPAIAGLSSHVPHEKLSPKEQQAPGTELATGSGSGPSGIGPVAGYLVYYTSGTRAQDHTQHNKNKSSRGGTT